MLYDLLYPNTMLTCLPGRLNRRRESGVWHVHGLLRAAGRSAA